ncbi:UDP-2,3-diacylglucosamine diphosphatase [Halomonas sp. McH1-25]|uniref:UDP-2,3-diacylglucosamine diphosphatase n=1 Tax=unclassified Halomonas TaxID=2609666 RepID=UPI001EF487A4|nr:MULTISPECIES: UDP-2,3-diacylglucosamine diphosphatase [unclassified Halomonas]MCG7598690.1 UDP-2,3-diacylglucosamine diphosphatase [Halomonas sp. McH1-25]MCP1340653.1 UDP-2,3-diacylglucosamine diphosphatase [Halomonas sp. FL8]MCP1359424.1 UDP-2,3-diacylglucosamine diphosphatase [Halomonas sp. BBD45]MCP1364425.1 UDP-2,3-diacylglucosamine diphosphatase [Halomonas sp. BBD48]
MTIRLISDLHLHAGAPEIAEGFLRYLDERGRHAESLYILGDFFEAWIGDDYQGEFEARIIAALKDVSDSGTQLYFMHGNRDFLIGEGFAQATGSTLLPDPSIVTLGDQRILLMHGDSLCTRDETYMKFRAMVRDPQWQAQILALPVEQRLELARSLRSQSGEASSNKAEDIMDVTPEDVVHEMAQHNVRTLIHGHTHRPAVHELQVAGDAAKRIVLGDWQPHQGWEIRIETNGQPELLQFTF